MRDVHIIHIDGRSYRLREIDGLLRPSNPTPSNCANLGVYKTDSGIFLAEWKNDKWVRYADYTRAILGSDLWFASPTNNHVVQFSTHCKRYDFSAQDGRNNIGDWIEASARLAGR